MRISRATSNTAVFLLALAACGAIWWSGAPITIQAASTANLLSPEGQAEPASKPKWNWDREASSKYGPAKWATISPKECGNTGIEQSPVNLVVKPGLTPTRGIRFDYHKFSSAATTSSGYKLEVPAVEGGGIWIQGEPELFGLVEFHIHTRSEHEIGGQLADFEVHLVHQAPSGLAVIGVLMKKVQAKQGNSEVAQMIKSAQSGNGFLVDPNLLLPGGNGNGLYYEYQGSLTTPPCGAVKYWMVAQSVGEVNESDITALKGFIKNFKNVQETNGISDLNNRPVNPKASPTIRLFRAPYK
jgi:carbonic anhydrase